LAIPTFSRSLSGSKPSEIANLNFCEQKQSGSQQTDIFLQYHMIGSLLSFRKRKLCTYEEDILWEFLVTFASLQNPFGHMSNPYSNLLEVY
jgi:hypothetical protein